MWSARQVATAVTIAAALGVIWLAGSKEDAPGPGEPTAVPPTSAPASPASDSAVTGVPGLDFTRPDEVARAYVIAAHSISDRDRGQANRRVVPYLAPNNPDNPRGLVVADAPPDGQRTTVVVDELTVVAQNGNGRAIAFQARWTGSTGTPETPALRIERRTTYLVLARQPDGRWLLTKETSRLQPSDDG